MDEHFVADAVSRVNRAFVSYCSTVLQHRKKPIC
jgi:hypothetical protein